MKILHNFLLFGLLAIFGIAQSQINGGTTIQAIPGLVQALQPGPYGQYMGCAIQNGAPFGGNGLSNGSDTVETARMEHWTGNSITSDWRFVDGNFATASMTYAAASDAMTVTRSIEYPAGTFNQVTWQGAVSVVIQPGGTAVSDPCPVRIPANTQFWDRTCVTVASGKKWYRTRATFSGAGAGGITTGSDVTMSGTITNSTGYCYGPLAVLGRQFVQQPVILIIGDSIGAGTNDSGFSNGVSDYNWQGGGLFGRSVSKTYASYNMDIASLGVAGFANSVLKRMEPLVSCCTVAIVQLGTNDQATALATTPANYLALYAFLKGHGLKVYQCTQIPHTTSSDNWATANNQTVTANEAKRTGFNDWIRAGGILNLDGYIDTAATCEVNSSNVLTLDGGFFKAGFSDAGGAGLHMSATGYAATYVPIANFLTSLSVNNLLLQAQPEMLSQMDAFNRATVSRRVAAINNYAYAQ